LANRDLGAVLITPELAKREPQPIDFAAVNQTLKYLSTFIIARDPQGLIWALTDAARELCHAGTGGISVLETNEQGEDIFRWDALSGALAYAVGGTTPREWSPCGVTLKHNSPQLFRSPEKCFPEFKAANPAIVEGLVLPLCFPNGEAFGTMWVTSHDEKQKFTSADVEVMQSLCAFTMAAARILGMRSRLRAARQSAAS
jgi:GAF domain-containing protein